MSMYVGVKLEDIQAARLREFLEIPEHEVIGGSELFKKLIEKASGERYEAFFPTPVEIANNEIFHQLLRMEKKEISQGQFEVLLNRILNQLRQS